MNATIAPRSDEFVVDFPGFESIHIRRMVLDDDIATLHRWFTNDYARFWGMRNKTLAEARQKYAETLAKPGHEVMIGTRPDGERLFLLECYDPTHDLLAKYYDARPTDRGFHIMIAPPDSGSAQQPGLSYRIFVALTRYLFNNSSVQRVVAEPDLANAKVLVRFMQSGYAPLKVIHLPYKTAQLVAITREQAAQVDPVKPPPRPELPNHALRVRFHYLMGRLIRKLFPG